MVFSSLLFLFRFLPAVLLAYYIVPKKCRNFVLFIGSLIFYAWGEPVYIFLILFSTTVDYAAGRIVSHCQEKENKKGAVAALCVSIVTNLSLLGFFKYAGFFLRVIGRLTGLSVPVLNISLPIGISFYTFQTMSYTIDIYRKDAKVQKNFIDFGAYVSLFPQLIAGPIIRYKTVADQLKGRKESVDLFLKGIVRFMAGFGKKVLLANQIGELWNEAAAISGSEMTTAAAWIGILAFTFQIYFDFSGYSDMAIGLGAMFGFTFPENFDYPYESKSITQFWRRWHISLGTWFKEYVYIPLGGNRKGIKRQMLNIAIVWLLTGLWHGAYANFVLWGIYYGVLLVVEKLLWKPVISRLPKAVGHIYTMLAVMIGWSLFSWQDMADRKGYMKALFFMAGGGLYNDRSLYMLTSNLVLFLVCIVGSASFLKRLKDKCLPEGTVRREAANMAYILAVFLAGVAMLVNSSYNPFLYFRF